ncbi:MAG: hypothetical protein GYA69_00970 [Candidatus Moranbacteria bacterium]|nr:hypothetical protein [Candidatus Moranbacteria bacterium]
MKAKRDLRNCLVQYRGGGYDGCIWEWNYFFIDGDGQFNNIFSSGHNGIKEESQLEDFDFDDKNVYIYDLTDKKQADEFIKETNEQDVVRISKILYDDFDINLIGTCEECGTEFALYDAHHSGYTGNGGIGIINTGIVCSDCYYTGTCVECEEYVTPKEITYLENEDKSLCEYCLQDFLHDEVPPELINKILFETSDFDLEKVKAALNRKVGRKVLDNLLTWEDLEKFASENDCEFKPLDSRSEKLWGFFKPDYQLPNPNQIELELYPEYIF